MILLDTHIRVWLVSESDRITPSQRMSIINQADDGLGVSVFSCWEVAKLVERGRLTLSLPVSEWIDHALTYPGIELLDLTPTIAVESTQLPGTFHRDPADQILVATARVWKIPLVTQDAHILEYPHVSLFRLS